MALVTGSAMGTITQQEDLYVEGAPTIFFQRYEAGPLYNPDANGYYWQLSGTATYPVYEVGCITDVSLSEDITINDVLCDNVGVKSSIQQRNYLEFTFTIQSFFPFTVLTNLLKGATATQAAPNEFFTLGAINNARYWQVWAPKVYDSDVGDYVGIQLHKAQFVEAFTIDMSFGSPWQATGLRLRAFVDTTKTPDQFATWVRSDASVIT